MHVTQSKLQDLHQAHVAEIERVNILHKQVKDIFKTLVSMNREVADMVYRTELINHAH